MSDTLLHSKLGNQLERETVSAYMPIIKVYMMTMAAYYLIVTVNHFTSETGFTLIVMAAMSVGTSLITVLFYRALKPDSSLLRLEILGGFANAFMLANLLYFYTSQYDSHRLVYFVLMVFIFALTGATRRIAIVSSLAALTSLYAVIFLNEPALLQIYIYIGIASTLAALGCSLALRQIITNTLNAKFESASRKADAVEAAEHAIQLSVTDNLTGLPNRRDFFRVIKMRAAHYLKNQGILAVFLIDLDDFKPVNDTYGHNVGDSLLIAIGERLRSTSPEQIYFARIGGDEFAAIATVNSEMEAQTLGASLCEAMRARFNLGRNVVHVGATVGVAIRKDRTISPEKLVEYADYALFRAKRFSKGSCALFTQSDAEEMTQQFIIDQALRGADLKRELEVVYQPQYNIAEDRVTGFEALARWNSLELGKMVAPTSFIKAAEASGQISDITQILLSKALENFKIWPAYLQLSFNLSVHDILNMSAIDRILKIVENSGVPASRICFELTETVMMTDNEKAVAALNKLVANGHQVALDDFGTGYSNFAYLHKLPIEKIKIDQSFIRGISENESSATLIASLLSLTRSLNKDCIIEGIETEAEYLVMKSLGVQTVQGYYCGRPMPAMKALEMLQKRIIPTSALKAGTG